MTSPAETTAEAAPTAPQTPAQRYAAIRERAREAYAAWNTPAIPRISIAEDTSSLAAGAGRTRQALERLVSQRNAAVELGRVVGYGMQWLQPLADITWPDGTRILYGPVTPQNVELLLDEATGVPGAADRIAIGMLAGERAGIRPIEEHPFLALETKGRRLMGRIGRTDPNSLDHYVATDGYFAVARMLDRHQTPEQVRQTMIDGGLAGRGGAWFPRA